LERELQLLLGIAHDDGAAQQDAARRKLIARLRRRLGLLDSWPRDLFHLWRLLRPGRLLLLFTLGLPLFLAGRRDRWLGHGGGDAVVHSAGFAGEVCVVHSGGDAGAAGVVHSAGFGGAAVSQSGGGAAAVPGAGTRPSATRRGSTSSVMRLPGGRPYVG